MRSEIDSPSKRAKLAARRNPYWQGISGGRGGVSLGYRKAGQGPGAWVAKVVTNSQRCEERLGLADDDSAGGAGMPFRSAVGATIEWAAQQGARLEAEAAGGPTSRVLTVRSAVQRYIERRKKQAGPNVGGRLTNYVLADTLFADLPMAKLRASKIEAWRERLPLRADGVQRETKEGRFTSISASTLNRILNDLRAALNEAAEKHRRELPAYLAAEIRVGTRAVAATTQARKQILSDDQVRRIVEAAFAVDEAGDFGRLVLVLAATGARYSQAVRLRIDDVQPAMFRLMIPASRKGRSASAKPAIPVAVSAAVIERLAPAIADRASDEPLLLRWGFRHAGVLRWERDKRRAWGAAFEIEQHWRSTVAAADVPADTVCYALRHSSIVRGLKAGLPVRLVAALHDTSIEMIEAHYSAFIADAAEELTRRAALAFG